MATRTGLRLGGDPADFCVDADGGLVRRTSLAAQGLDSLLTDGPLEADEALRILHAAALAVDSVRWSGRGFHGRLRPEVIVIGDRDDSVFVAGFGAGDDPPESSRAARYMAPEVLRGAPLEASADTYALGAILYEAVTGERPFLGGAHSTTAEDRSPPPSPRKLRSTLPADLDAVIDTALATRPEDRYSTCADLLIAAEAAFNPKEDPAPRKEPLPGVALPDHADCDFTGLLTLGEDRLPLEVADEAERRSTRNGRLLTVAIVIGIAAFVGAMVALDSGRSTETPAVVSGSADGRSESVTGVFRDEEAPAVAVHSGSDTQYASSAGANSVVRIDGRTGRIDNAVPVGSGLVAIEAGDDVLWALSAGDGTVAKIDVATDEVLETIRVDGVPVAGAAIPGLDAVWVVNAGNGQIIEIVKRDFGEGHSQSAFAVGSPPTLLTNAPTSMVLSDDAGWVARSTRVVRVDLPSKLPTAIAAGGGQPSQLALGGGSLWIGDREGTVRRLDPATLETLAEVNVGGFVAGMVWADDALWVSACDAAGGLIAVVDSTTNTLARRSRVRGCSFGIDAGFGSIWLASPSHERVLELDPSNSSILSLIPVNGRPVDLAVAERGVYVALGTD